MLLRSFDGPFFELKVAGYQFPDGYEISGKRVYPDWLNVDGWIRTQTVEWRFSFACLAAGEALELGDWLVAIAGRRAVAERLEFIEPNLAFTLVEIVNEAATLRVEFRQEACPPDEPRGVRLGFGYPLLFRVHLDQLAETAAAWNREILPFPERDGVGV